MNEYKESKLIELLEEQNALLKHRNTQLTVLHHDLERIAENLDKIWGAFP